MKTGINQLIDHTLLKPDATAAQIEKLCTEALHYWFHSVCINPCRVKQAALLLNGSGIAVCTVVGFPLGASGTAIKCAEASEAVAQGATEIDMVINIGAVKDGNWDFVCEEINSVVNSVRNQAIVKVILETCLLTQEEKKQACEICHQAGAHFVKTSTGFSNGGAKVEDIRLMKATVGTALQVKASGGISSYAAAIAMVEAGADRIGTSAGVTIVEEERKS